jgi:glycerol-3-phosphate O-acyltransferase/dihydroxyacetone phosphate acyltransferase
MAAFRAGLLWTFKRIVSIYFREIEVVGDVPPRATGGRIFAANHVNGLVDPVLVMTTTDCAICPVAKSTLWKIPGLRWLLDAVEAVPVVRRKDDPNKPQSANDEIFDRVAKHLGSGGNILIFPEGTSHNEPQLVALKSGAGRMLAAARAHGARRLTFQTVGLEFDARDVFRSRALLVYGPVRDVDAIAGREGAAREGAAREGDLTSAITAQLREDLSELIVEGATWEERILIARVAEIFANDAGDATLATWNVIGRQVEAAKKALRAQATVQYDEIARAVGRYHTMLEASGLRDASVAAGAPRTRSVLRVLFYAAALPFAIVGAVLYFLPYQLPRIAARFARGEADTVSTYKLGTGMLVFPAWAFGLIVLAFALLPAPLAAFAALIAITSPFASLAWLDRSDRRAQSRLTPGPTLDALREARADARAILDRTRRDLGLASS